MSQPLSSWTCIHHPENRRDSTLSEWNGTHWESTFITQDDSVGNDIFFFAPDTLDFELLLNGRSVLSTSGQGAILPGIEQNGDYPIYSWSKACRPFKLDLAAWKAHLRNGENKLLLKIKTAPTDLGFAFQSGVYVVAKNGDPQIIQLRDEVYRDGKLPAVVIEVHQTMLKQKEKAKASFKLLCNETSLNCDDFERDIEIGIRGFSSALFPKKQYSFKFSGDTLKKEKLSLLGMNEASKWILQGPYSDPSLIRNALAYEIWRDMGYHAPQSRFVEVIMNGVYQGVYLLMERNEISPARLDLHTKSDGSDAFLIQLNRPDRSDVVINAGGMQFIVDDPPGVMVDSLYLKHIRETMEQFVAATNDPALNGKDIDWNSWADFFIMQELSKNPDAYMVSTFIHRGNSSEQAPLKAGPVWDFDIAFGGSQIMNGDKPDGFVAEFSGQALSVFKHLFQQKKFRSLMDERYKMWRQSVLSDSHLNLTIDSISSIIDDDARYRNFKRFPAFGMKKYLTHPAPVTDYPTELLNMKNWLQRRTQWLDTHLPVNGN